MTKKSKYLSKTISYAGKRMTLFSLDGDTWSSRPEELETIMARHEQEKANYSGQIKGGPQARIPTSRPKPTSAHAQHLRPGEGEGLDEGGAKPSLAPPPSAPAELNAKAAEPRAVAAKSDGSASKASKVSSKAPAKKPQAKKKAPLPVKASASSAAGAKQAAAPKRRAGSQPAKAAPKAKARIGKKSACR
jgi:hypothetical protein